MIYYNGCGCLKTEFFILGAVFLFWGLLTHSFNKYLSQRLCGSWSLQDPILWRGYCSATNTGCVCSLRRGDSTLLGPGPARAILRQFRSLRHHVGHRREKRDGHRAPRTQVRLWAVLPESLSQQAPDEAVRRHMAGFWGAFTPEGARQEHSNRLFNSVSSESLLLATEVPAVPQNAYSKMMTMNKLKAKINATKNISECLRVRESIVKYKPGSL